MAEAYAAKHRLKLDRQLSFRDLGISAFRSENAREGKLRAFLEAIEHNLVPEGSVLLIESLDRLSRDRILSAQALFMQIIQAGVTLVTLVDQRSYSLESINRNPLDLIISLVTMMRANEESEIKSQRIKAVFDVKRSQLSKRPWSARCPGWLRLNKATSRFEIVDERADLVRRIFRMRLAGISQQSIVRQLNEERVPLFGHGNQRGKMWQKALIRHLLYTPTVVGTLVPFTTEWMDGIRRLRPQTPVENYYPAIIEREDWDKIQVSRAAWATHYRCNGPKTGRANLLAGLARCPFCDARLVLFGAGHENWRYYMCRKAYNGTGCSDHWIRYPGIEIALTTDIREVINSCPKPALTSDARRHRLRHIRVRLATLRQRQRSMQAETGLLRQSLRPRVIASENRPKRDR
jgi:DNA invertase Pin-like site-specific DNA recombinase